MKKTLVIVGVILGILLLVGGTFVGKMLSLRNAEIGLDTQVETKYVANQSNYDNMWKSFKEMTQVTELQAEQMKDVYMGLIEGRYQDEKLLFKMVKEQNPQLDTTVYTKLQNEITSGRKAFDNNQKALADMVGQYNIFVKRHFIGDMVFNWQEKDPNDYIVTSERTQKAFEDKKDDVINLKDK